MNFNLCKPIYCALAYVSACTLGWMLGEFFTHRLGLSLHADVAWTLASLGSLLLFGALLCKPEA